MSITPYHDWLLYFSRTKNPTALIERREYAEEVKQPPTLSISLP